MLSITTDQIQHLLLNGSIDGVQISKALDDSFFKTFKDGKELHTSTGLPSQDPVLNDMRQRCQSRHKLKSADIFFNKTIDDYKCVCFTWHGEKYCYLSKGVTANLNLCEIFRMKCASRPEVSLIDKVGGFRIAIPLR